MIEKIKAFKERHENIYEFIMFNILSNIATITNFIVLNLCMNLFFRSLTGQSFHFLIFDYTPDNGGFGGFLSFLISFFAAQAVNFIVQRKLVFNSNNKLGAAIPIYFLAVIIVYIICLYIPTIVNGPISSVVGSFWGTNLTNVINIIVQVILIYPVLKFVVMRKVEPETK